MTANLAWYAVGSFIAICGLLMVGLTLLAAATEIRDSWRGTKRAVVGTGKFLGYVVLANLVTVAVGLGLVLAVWFVLILLSVLAPPV